MSPKVSRFFFSLLLSSSAFSAISLAVASPAHAWFEVCNRASKKAHVAFAYFDAFDNRSRPAPVAMGSHWQSEGWWTLNPGQCAKVYPHELWRRNSYYYVYAESYDRRTVWTGKNNFCIARGTAFTIFQADLRINTATFPAIANGCYGASRIERVGFAEVKIQGRTQNLTYSLTN